MSGFTGVTKVEGESPVYVLSGNKTSPVAGALRSQEMKVVETGIDIFPENFNELSLYKALVMDNINAGLLTGKQIKCIMDYVSFVGGLLVIGGEDTLGRGEFYNTGLEDILPVNTDTRQRLFFSRATLLFIIDNSGSMSDQVYNKTKLQIAMDGAITAVKDLNPEDEAGILCFDTEANWVLPFTPVKDILKDFGKLKEVQQGDGTEISSSLVEAINVFSARGLTKQHIIILTDGNTQDKENIKQLIDKLAALKVNITTIGIGRDIDVPLLKNIADWGGGKFYKTEIDQVPNIMYSESMRVTEDLIREGNFYPEVIGNSTISKELSKNLPDIKGYLITKSKKYSLNILTIGKNEPLLSIARYGNGKTAVFTSDSGKRWSFELIPFNDIFIILALLTIIIELFIRSNLLGQFKMIFTILSLQFSNILKTVTKLSGNEPLNKSNSNNDEDIDWNTYYESYKYLSRKKMENKDK